MTDRLFRERFHAQSPAFVVSPATAADHAFLSALFAECWRESMRRAGGDPDALPRSSLDMMFVSQGASYGAAYPEAVDLICWRRRDDRPIGRAMIDWTGEAAVRGIDIAIRPGARAGAPGLALLRAWLSTCDETGREARLSVLPDNPARRLYRRLGFVETAPTAFPLPMARMPCGPHPVTAR